MKALAVFPASREVKIVDHPEPNCAGPTEVKVRILEAGICGTDREIADFRYGAPPADSPYQIIGHEAPGEVVEVGSSITELVPGDLAVLMVRRPCPRIIRAACTKPGSSKPPGQDFKKPPSPPVR
jgi:glucose 1-dehydrogenase